MNPRACFRQSRDHARLRFALAMMLAFSGSDAVAVGNVVSVTDPLGHTTSYDYTDSFTNGTNNNTQGFVTKVTYPTTNSVAHVERKQYYWYTGLTAAECGQNYPAASGCAFTSTPTASDHYAFTYDLLNRPLKRFAPDGSTNELVYNDTAKTITLFKPITATKTQKTIAYFDGLARKTRTELCENPTCSQSIKTDTTYDAGGKVHTVTNPYRSTTGEYTYGINTTLYDGLGRVRFQIHPDNNQTETQYAGNRVLVIDEVGNDRYSYTDALGRLINVVEDPGGLHYNTHYKYDALGNLLCVEQRGSAQTSTVTCGDPYDNTYGGNWRVRKFKYNSLSQLLEARNPETNLISYTYDYDGRLATKTDARGITTTYGYDELHRVVNKTYSNSEPASSFAYDESSVWGSPITNPVGRLTSFSHAGTAKFFKFDTRGRTTTQIECNISTCGITATGVYVAYHYDGSLNQLIYPSGRVVVNDPDDTGRLKKVWQSNLPVWEVPDVSYGHPGYHPHGVPNHVLLGNGLIDNAYYNNRLQTWQFTLTNSQTQFMNKIYLYGPNNNGNIVEINDQITPVRTQYFGYDSLNRISAALEYPGAGGWGQSYTIDAWGNLTNVGNYDSSNLSPYGYNQNASAANRAEDTGSGFQYDPAGNMTENGSDEYTWDAESRMTNYGGVWNYVYDANGMRARKEKVVNNVVTDWTEYVYFGGNVIAEKDISGAWTDYIFAGGKRVAKIAAGNISYYHSDHLGSSTAMSDASGDITSQQTFLPYGCEFNRTTGSCAGTVPANHYKFTGKERDSESNLDYFGARYYSNTMGRWMSPDFSDEAMPIPYSDLRNPQSLNQYSYVSNQPTGMVDPDGHAAAAAPLIAACLLNPPLCAAAVGTAVILTVAANTPAGREAIDKATQAINDAIGSTFSSDNSGDKKQPIPPPAPPGTLEANPAAPGPTDPNQDRKGGDKNDKKQNADKADAAKQKLDAAREKLGELKKLKRTKGVAEEIKKTEKQIKHWAKKAAEKSENHARTGQRH